MGTHDYPDFGPGMGIEIPKPTWFEQLPNFFRMIPEWFRNLPSWWNSLPNYEPPPELLTPPSSIPYGPYASTQNEDPFKGFTDPTRVREGHLPISPSKFSEGRGERFPDNLTSTSSGLEIKSALSNLANLINTRPIQTRLDFSNRTEIELKVDGQTLANAVNIYLKTALTDFQGVSGSAVLGNHI
jgi:hypothetical protein